jgi:hypothetical protein
MLVDEGQRSTSDYRRSGARVKLKAVAVGQEPIPEITPTALGSAAFLLPLFPNPHTPQELPRNDVKIGIVSRFFGDANLLSAFHT